MERSDEMHGKPAAVGLVKPRESAKIGAWLEKYIGGRTDLKPRSRDSLEATRDKLLEHFDKDLPMRSIEANAASEWRDKLMRSGLAEATIKGHVGNSKGLFNEAKRRGLISANPFDHLSGGATATKDARY